MVELRWKNVVLCCPCLLIFIMVVQLCLQVAADTQNVLSSLDTNALLGITSMPRIGADGKTYVCDNRRLLVYNQDGTMAWSTIIEAGPCEQTVPPVIDPLGKIVDSKGWLYAINAWQPFLRWRYNLNLTGNMTEAGVTAGNNGLVYVAIVEPGIVCAFDAPLGSLLWKSNVGPLSFTTCFPIVDLSGWVFLGSLDGYVYALSTDGTQSRSYLSSTAANSVIQTCPYLDCKGEVLFVAQVELESKRTTITNGLPAVSYLFADKVIVSMLNPFTGTLMWSAEYPDESYTTIYNSSYNLDSSLLLALVAQNLSNNGLCTNSERNLIVSCLISYVYPQIQGYHTRQFRALYITLPLIFVLLVGASVLVYVLWHRKQTRSRIRLRDQRRKGQGLPSNQNAISRSKARLEKLVSNIMEMLQKEPASKKLQDQLRVTMQALKFAEELCLSSSEKNKRADSLKESNRDVDYRALQNEADNPWSSSRSIPLDTKKGTKVVIDNPLFKPLEADASEHHESTATEISAEISESEGNPLLEESN